MNRLLFATLLAAVAAASIVNDEGPFTPEIAESEDYELDEYGTPKLQETVPESRQNLNLGTIGPDDRLLARIHHNVAASAFVIHDQDVTFRGVQYTNITAIRVSRNGATQNAVPSIRAGGLRHDFVVIGIKGVRGRSFDYTIQIYASINCSNS